MDAVVLGSSPRALLSQPTVAPVHPPLAAVLPKQRPPSEILYSSRAPRKLHVHTHIIGLHTPHPTASPLHWHQTPVDGQARSVNIDGP